MDKTVTLTQSFKDSIGRPINFGNKSYSFHVRTLEGEENRWTIHNVESWTDAKTYVEWYYCGIRRCYGFQEITKN